jgi:hypothetical protein
MVLPGEVNPVRNSSGPLNPAGIIIKPNSAAQQRGIISNGVNIISYWVLGSTRCRPVRDTCFALSFACPPELQHRREVSAMFTCRSFNSLPQAGVLRHALVIFLNIPHSAISIPHLERPTFVWMTPNYKAKG